MRPIQFQIKDRLLYDRLNEDVARSRFSTRSPYMVRLVEHLLSRPLLVENSSALDRLIFVDDVFYSSPVEQIASLAQTQNRNYTQMHRHLIDIALLHYRGMSFDLATAKQTVKDHRNNSSLIIPSRLL